MRGGGWDWNKWRDYDLNYKKRRGGVKRDIFKRKWGAHLCTLRGKLERGWREKDKKGWCSENKISSVHRWIGLEFEYVMHLNIVYNLTGGIVIIWIRLRNPGIWRFLETPSNSSESPDSSSSVHRWISLNFWYVVRIYIAYNMTVGIWDMFNQLIYILVWMNSGSCCCNSQPVWAAFLFYNLFTVGPSLNYSIVCALLVTTCSPEGSAWYCSGADV